MDRLGLGSDRVQRCIEEQMVGPMEMSKWFTLSTHDVSLSQKFFVFFERTRDEGPVLRAEYRDLACPKCKKFNELAALERGINPEVKLRVQRDAVESEDGILVVSEKSKIAL